MSCDALFVELCESDVHRSRVTSARAVCSAVVMARGEDTGLHISRSVTENVNACCPLVRPGHSHRCNNVSLAMLLAFLIIKSGGILQCSSGLWIGRGGRNVQHGHQLVCSYMLSVCSYCCQSVHTAVSLFILLSVCSYCCQSVHTAVSMFILLSVCSYCYQSVHTAVSLFILLSVCSYCYQSVHTAISLFILLSVCSYCCQSVHTTVSLFILL